MLHAAAGDTNPKRQRGRQTVTSLTLRASRGWLIPGRGRYNHGLGKIGVAEKSVSEHLYGFQVFGRTRLHGTPARSYRRWTGLSRPQSRQQPRRCPSRGPRSRGLLRRARSNQGTLSLPAIRLLPHVRPLVADPGEYRWSSYRTHGMGQDDPLLSSFAEWEELGRSEAERRWRATV